MKSRLEAATAALHEIGGCDDIPFLVKRVAVGEGIRGTELVLDVEMRHRTATPVCCLELGCYVPFVRSSDRRLPGALRRALGLHDEPCVTIRAYCVYEEGYRYSTDFDEGRPHLTTYFPEHFGAYDTTATAQEPIDETGKPELERRALGLLEKHFASLRRRHRGAARRRIFWPSGVPEEPVNDYLDTMLDERPVDMLASSIETTVAGPTTLRRKGPYGDVGTVEIRVKHEGPLRRVADAYTVLWFAETDECLIGALPAIWMEVLLDLKDPDEARLVRDLEKQIPKLEQTLAAAREAALTAPTGDEELNRCLARRLSLCEKNLARARSELEKPR